MRLKAYLCTTLFRHKKKTGQSQRLGMTMAPCKDNGQRTEFLYKG